MFTDFNSNKTMKVLAELPCITADSNEGEMIKDLLQGMGLPLTDTNIMLASYGMSLGLHLASKSQRS